MNEEIRAILPLILNERDRLSKKIDSLVKDCNRLQGRIRDSICRPEGDDEYKITINIAVQNGLLMKKATLENYLNLTKEKNHE